jgi:hypothetical protein
MRKKPEKLPFINVCATCGFTPSGLAAMAGVDRWVVYAMLDQGKVPKIKAQAVLQILTEFNDRHITYTLDNVDVVLEPDEESEDAHHAHETDRSDR